MITQVYSSKMLCYLYYRLKCKPMQKRLMILVLSTKTDINLDEANIWLRKTQPPPTPD